jgi:YD repeat-containing protein
MRRYGVVVAVLASLVLDWSFGGPASAQGNADVNGSGTMISDRQKAGLRGPVRSVEDERTYPAITSGDGTVDPELKSWKKAEYDREGRISAIWGRDSSREHGLGAALYVTRYSYDAAARLQKTTREKDGVLDGETIYRYDDRGRLESITNSKDPGNPIAFRYDADGRKSKVAIAKPVEPPEGLGERTAVSYSPEYLFEVETSSPSVPDGGSAVTLYDDQDRPIEVQTRNTSGGIMFRMQRVYDDQGHVLEEKTSMDDVLSMIPAAEQKKMMDQGGVSAQEFRDQVAPELREQVAKLLGGSEMSSIKYTYDAQGRETLKIHKAMGQIEQRVETSYNEHGDVAKETWQDTNRATPDDANDRTTTITEQIYSYKYDSYGNWTVKSTSSRKLPDGVLKDSGDVDRRTIEYY